MNKEAAAKLPEEVALDPSENDAELSMDSETAEEAAQTITIYGQLLRGEVTGAQLWRELKLVRQLGVTRGPMA